MRDREEAAEEYSAWAGQMRQLGFDLKARSCWACSRATVLRSHPPGGLGQVRPILMTCSSASKRTICLADLRPFT